MADQERRAPPVREMVHDEAAGLYILHMEPADAFARYRIEGDTKVLSHVEVDPAWRGTGLGARFATAVLNRVMEEGGKARITCSYMRGLAQTRPEWVAHYGLAG